MASSQVSVIARPLSTNSTLIRCLISKTQPCTARRWTSSTATPIRIARKPHSWCNPMLKMQKCRRKTHQRSPPAPPSSPPRHLASPITPTRSLSNNRQPPPQGCSECPQVSFRAAWCLMTRNRTCNEGCSKQNACANLSEEAKSFLNSARVSQPDSKAVGCRQRERERGGSFQPMQ